MAVHIDVKQVDVAEILALRDLYRQEMNCQIIHDSLHRRGFNDSYLIWVDGRVAGYGTATSGQDEHKVFERGILNEFYLLPTCKAFAVPVFRQLLTVSKATQIQAQTNDDFATDISSDRILFHDAFTTNLSVPGAVFRQATQADAQEDNWLIEVEGNIVTTGGFLTHYNPPYGDIYMAGAEPHRRCGYGSYIVQELKRVCYEAGRRPAARCNAANVASRKTLEKVGFLPCTRMVMGRIATDNLTDV